MPIYKFNTDLRSHIQRNLDGFDARQIDRGDMRDAAVAVVVTKDTNAEQSSILMTLRPQKLNRHGGQYALPGGRLDDGETDEDAALRELHEELGLALRQNDILGRLDHFPTRSGFRISPIVMWADEGHTLHPDPSEVAEVFHLPMEEIDSPDIPRLEKSASSDHPVMSAYFPTLGHHMYAPTAAVLFQFREVALRGKPTRVSHLDQPAFAWK